MKSSTRNEESAVLRAARRYTSRGWRVVPIPAKSKKPCLKGWQKLRLKESDLPDYFESGDNLGILLGKPSGGLVDSDLDCDEAVLLGPKFLPYTGRIHGRESRPSSHGWYKSIPAPSSRKFEDVDGTSIAELRSTGEQTIVPPSIHPSGEKIKWESKEPPARVDPHELCAAIAKLAAAALIARHWPAKGSRHHAALALSGMLVRAGWDDLEVGEFVSAVAKAAGDEEWRFRKANAITTRKRLEENAPATGQPSLAKLIGENVAARAREWLGIGQRTDRPQTATEPTWPKPLTDEAYYGLPGDIIRNIGPETEADPAAMLVQLLLGYGSAVGRKAHISIGPSRHYANLFCAVVGKTATSRKGTSWAEVSSPLKAAAPGWWDHCFVPGGLASGEGLIWRIRDASLSASGAGDKRLLVVETEFASLLRVMARHGNTLSPVIRSAFDTGDLANLPKKFSARVTGAHVSIVGHTTLDDLRHELRTTESYNGFANRFLWVCATRSQILAFGGKLPEKVFRTHVEELRKAINFGSKQGEISFSERASALWEQKYSRLSKELPGVLGAVTSRGPVLVLRMALIYALINRSPIIKTQHVKAALEIWRYCYDSARYIFGDVMGDVVGDTILKALKASAQGLTRTEIRDLFHKNKSREQISRALAMLKEFGLADFENEKTGGRQAERWFATQKAAI